MIKDWKVLQDLPSYEWPENAGELLLAVLRDAEVPEPERLLATELASDVTIMNDEIATTLLSIAGNEDEFESVRAQAAISLGPALELADIEGYDDQYTHPPISERLVADIRRALHKLYTDAGVPIEVRRRVLEGSVRGPDDWHPAAVRAAWGSDDELWRLTAVFCMRFIRGFDKEIVTALRDRSAEIRHEAIVAAGNWGVDAAWPAVKGVVTSEKKDVSMLLAAIEAVASIRPDEAVDLLVPLLDSEREEIAEAAHDALAMAEAHDAEFDEDDEDE